MLKAQPIGEKLVYTCFKFLKKAYWCYKSCIFCLVCMLQYDALVATERAGYVLYRALVMGVARND